MPECLYWPFTFRGQSCLHLQLTDTEHADKGDGHFSVTAPFFLSILLRNFLNVDCEKTI